MKLSTPDFQVSSSWSLHYTEISELQGMSHGEILGFLACSGEETELDSSPVHFWNYPHKLRRMDGRRSSRVDIRALPTLRYSFFYHPPINQVSAVPTIVLSAVTWAWIITFPAPLPPHSRLNHWFLSIRFLNTRLGEVKNKEISGYCVFLPNRKRMGVRASTAEGPSRHR